MMSETVDVDGYEVTITQDEDASDPLSEDYGVAGTMATWHSRYRLGNIQPGIPPEKYLRAQVPYKVIEDLDRRLDRVKNREYEYRYSIRSGDSTFRFDYDKIREGLETRIGKVSDEWIRDNLVKLDVYLYDHSGLRLSSAPFGCPWDSGQLGFFFLTPEEVLKEWDGDKKKAKDYLEATLKTYGQYVAGEVFGVSGIEDPDGEEVEDGSCWGFYGYDNEASGLMEFVRDAINQDRISKAVERQERFNAACRDIVTV